MIFSSGFHERRILDPPQGGVRKCIEKRLGQSFSYRSVFRPMPDVLEILREGNNLAVSKRPRLLFSLVSGSCSSSHPGSNRPEVRIMYTPLDKNEV